MMITFKFNDWSEKNDAQRITLYLKRKQALRATYYSVANQVKRNINEVNNDGKIYLETYFVY